MCVPNKIEDLIIITGKMNQGFLEKIYHANVNVNLLEENVI